MAQSINKVSEAGLVFHISSFLINFIKICSYNNLSFQNV